jgi:hypothetical protein
MDLLFINLFSNQKIILKRKIIDLRLLKISNLIVLLKFNILSFKLFFYSLI